MVEVNCIVCNKMIIAERGSKKFCSQDCHYKYIKTKTHTKKINFYSIETLCSCGCGQIILNPDNHNRFRKFIYGHANKNGLHPQLGYKESDEHIQYRIGKVLSHFRDKLPTCIEKELYNFLDSIGINYIKQHQIGKTIADAFIPKLNLCIYADGVYWHNKPEILERDQRINDKLTKLGYTFIRLNSINNGYNLDLNPIQFLNVYSGSY